MGIESIPEGTTYYLTLATESTMPVFPEPEHHVLPTDQWRCRTTRG
jgi:hypothetical protein